LVSGSVHRRQVSLEGFAFPGAGQRQMSTRTVIRICGTGYLLNERNSIVKKKFENEKEQRNTRLDLNS